MFLRKGDKLCHVGQKDDKLYVLLRGKLQLSIPRGGAASEKSPTLLRPVKTLKKPSDLVTFITAGKPETAACALMDLVVEDHGLEQKILANESIKTLDIFKQLRLQQEKRSKQSQHPLKHTASDAVDQVIQKHMQKFRCHTKSTWGPQPEPVSNTSQLSERADSADDSHTKQVHFARDSPSEGRKSPASHSLDASEQDSDIDSQGHYTLQAIEKDLALRERLQDQSDSELSPDDLQIDVGPDGIATEDFYGTLGAGDYFGELGLFCGQPKSMNVWCLSNCHLLALPRQAMERVKQMVQQRQYQDKISFLKSLSVFKSLNQKKIKTLMAQFRVQTKQRGSSLFREGQPANTVYIVTRGEFIVCKQLREEKPSFLESQAQTILKAPLKAKMVNEIHSQKCSTQTASLLRQNRGRLLGAEDVVSENRFYTMSAVCDSKTAEVFCISQENFCKLQSAELVWNAVKRHVRESVDKMSKNIVYGSMASDQIRADLRQALAVTDVAQYKEME